MIKSLLAMTVMAAVWLSGTGLAAAAGNHSKMHAATSAEVRGASQPDQAAAAGQRMKRCRPEGRPCAALQAADQGVAAGTTPERTAEVPYASGGIGNDDPAEQMLTDYNLKLVFALKGTGGYLADVKVAIHDLKGKKVLEAESPGPLFYTRLPPGQYRINADFNGKSLTRSANVKAGGRSVLPFHWDAE